MIQLDNGDDREGDNDVGFCHVTRFSGSCYLFIRIPGSANIFDDIPKTSIFIANVDSNDDSKDINNFTTILIKFILIISINTL